MYKKVAIVLSIVLLISFVGMLVFLPISIKDSINRFDTLVKDTKITTTTSYLNDDIKVLDLTNCNYGVLIKESKNNKLYVENYSESTTEPKNYYVEDLGEKQTKVHLSYSRYNQNSSWNKDIIEQTLVKNVQNLPDFIIYVPKDVKILVNDADDLDHSLNFEIVKEEEKPEKSTAYNYEYLGEVTIGITGDVTEKSQVLYDENKLGYMVNITVKPAKDFDKPNISDIDEDYYDYQHYEEITVDITGGLSEETKMIYDDYGRAYKVHTTVTPLDNTSIQVNKNSVTPKYEVATEIADTASERG